MRPLYAAAFAALILTTVGCNSCSSDKPTQKGGNITTSNTAGSGAPVTTPATPTTTTPAPSAPGEPPSTAALPDLPDYPGSTRTSFVPAGQRGMYTNGTEAQSTTGDSIEAVKKYFQTMLPKNGWQIGTASIKPEKVIWVASKGESGAMIELARTDSGTTIKVARMEK